MRHSLKQICCLLAACIIFAGSALPAAALEGAVADPGIAAGAAPAPEGNGPAVSAKSVILVEQSTMQPLFEKEADERLAPASITKVMTLLLVMEALDAGRIKLEDMVVCSQYASSMGGSQIWLEPNEQMSVHDLIKATAVASANDAAVALAEYIDGTEPAFVDSMNKRAQELGMVNTHFINCTGLDEEGHYTTARDIATMSGALLSHKRITEYTGIWMDELRGGKTELVNTNRLIYYYQGATGLKTGSTDNAGRCLCASATRAGMSLISVVLGAPTSDVQFGDSMTLLDWGFGSFMSVPIKLPESELPPLKVAHGVQENVSLYAEPPESVIIPRADEGKLAYEITLTGGVTAPVENNQTVGRVLVHIDSREICTFPVKTKCAVPKMTFGRALARLWKGLVSMGSAPASPPPAPAPQSETDVDNAHDIG